MKIQLLQARPPWMTLSRWRARVSKPLTTILLIGWALISLGINRPIFSQSMGNHQDRVDQESHTLPLTIYRERLQTVGANEQISYQTVGIGESFAVPPGSSIIIGNPPYPYQWTKASFLNHKNKAISEFKQPIPKDGERSSIIVDPTQKSADGDLRVEASAPVITSESTSSGSTAEKQVLNASNALHFEIKNIPKLLANSNSNANENQPFKWLSSSDILEISPSGNLSQFVAIRLKSPTTQPNNAKQISLNVALGNQVIGRVELIRAENANEWSVSKIENTLKAKYYQRDNLTISNIVWSRFCALMAGLGSYMLIAAAVYWYRTRIDQSEITRNRNPSLNDINPLFITSGINGKASLSRLQLLWFTILVMSVLVLLFVQTGSLSDLPDSVLALLGVSASGTILSGLTGLTKNRLSFVNWQWLTDQGWLTKNPTPTRWTDLLLDDDGSLNIYKFQLLFSSILVGITLVVSGGNNLLGFKIPANFPQLLGLSNIAYVLGKVVTPTGIPELNDQVSELVTLEKGLKTSTSNGSGPNKDDLATYLLKARNVAGMTKVAFSDLGGTKFDDSKKISDDQLLPPWFLSHWLVPAPSASPSNAAPQELLQARVDGSRAQSDGSGLR